MSTKKHNRVIKLQFEQPYNGIFQPNNDSKQPNNGRENTHIICKHCGKSISHRNHIKRHTRSCKEYAKHRLRDAVDGKDKIIEKLTEKTEQQEKELEALRYVEKEYLEFMKKVANNSIDKATTINNTNNINTNNTNNTNNINMFYVINHFKHAQNYEKLMEPPLTNEETKYIIENGALSGCFNLITNRCIDGIELKDRPFHCVDSSRCKYLLYSDNNWNIDSNGEKILGGAYPKVTKVFKPDKNIDYDNKIELEKHLDDMNQIIDLKKNGKKRILRELNKKTLLKNNIKQ
uniref:Cholesterol-binding START domain containing protein n=1 Tax=Mimivirus LCMiAC01 TaxID=2506608 RepID=A0A481Z224_9VIRU|nr:MAG: cholesterol-binding START domain containing protein [Mimivirus LCMiAC01]